jgi:hypothetical protein
MARTNKTGIDYFPFDIDFFQDDKIQLIEAEFGIKSSMIAIRLLCKIYKEGYFYQWGGDECLLFAKNAGAEFVPGAVDEVVKGLVRRCFFDKGCFDRFGILTSKGIQKRYFEATQRYKSVDVFEEYLLMDVSKFNNVNINKINADINSINDDTDQQKKGKEIENNNPPLPPLEGGTEIVVEKSWRDDFEMYLTDLRNAYRAIVIDTGYITERAKYHPGLNIKLSLEKSCKEYWATEAGWKRKKSSKTKNIDWKTTFTKALDIKSNQVWLQKGGKNEEQAIKYRKL